MKKRLKQVKLTNLVLVEGQSLETIEAKFGQAGINYNRYESKPTYFFRQHTIDIISVWNPEQKEFSRTNKSDIIEILGWPNYYRKNWIHYYARYRIEPGFDLSQLNGKITFTGGLLVEVTKISCG